MKSSVSKADRWVGGTLPLVCASAGAWNMTKAPSRRLCLGPHLVSFLGSHSRNAESFDRSLSRAPFLRIPCQPQPRPPIAAHLGDQAAGLLCLLLCCPPASADPVMRVCLVILAVNAGTSSSSSSEHPHCASEVCRLVPTNRLAWHADAT
jgi:hypothetical protein